MHFAAYDIGYFYPGGTVLAHAKINAQMANFYGAIVAFLADAIVTVLVTPGDQTETGVRTGRTGLGRSRPERPDPATVPKPKWWASPKMLGGIAAGIVVVLSFIFV